MRVGGGKNNNDVNLRWSPAFLFVSSISTGIDECIGRLGNRMEGIEARRARGLGRKLLNLGGRNRF